MAEAGVEGIVFADLKTEAAELAAEESKKFAANKNFKTAVFTFDVTKANEVNAIVDFAVATFGQIDYAINAVGVCPQLIISKSCNVLTGDYRLTTVKMRHSRILILNILTRSMM